MTTIACDGRVMAADTQISGDYIDHHEMRKVVVLNSGAICGMAGYTRVVAPFIEWLNNGCPPSEKPKTEDDKDFTALLLKKQGDVTELYCYESPEFVPFQVGWPAAIGSGAQFAMGAMFMGADAVKAVMAAIRYDVHSGGSVVCERLK